MLDSSLHFDVNSGICLSISKCTTEVWLIISCLDIRQRNRGFVSSRSFLLLQICLEVTLQVTQILHIFLQVKVSSQELETDNNRTERYSHRAQKQQRQQQKQRPVSFSMSDKYSDILTADHASQNAMKYKRISERVETNSTGNQDSSFSGDVMDQQTKLTVVHYSPSLAQQTPGFSRAPVKDKDQVMIQDSSEMQSDDPFVKFRYEQFNFGRTESTTVSVDQQARLKKKFEIIRKRQRKTLFRKSQKQIRWVSKFVVNS